MLTGKSDRVELCFIFRKGLFTWTQYLCPPEIVELFPMKLAIPFWVSPGKAWQQYVICPPLIGICGGEALGKRKNK